MAKGRTISAKELTSDDRSILELCSNLTNQYKGLISKRDNQIEYFETWGKVNLSRDAGAGRGGAKIQRDALCTRGRTDNAPFSNRNLRWHPLVVGSICPKFAKPISEIQISKTKKEKILNFTLEILGEMKIFSSQQVHELPDTYAVLPQHWEPHHDALKIWNEDDWSRNSCLISANEACTKVDAIETFVSLNATILVSKYQVSISSILEVTEKTLIGSNIKSIYDEKLRSVLEDESLYVCPVCKNPLDFTLENFRKGQRVLSWKPGWKENKQSEGDDNSPQIMHVDPLNELEIRHNSSNVRYGHRWCNITMTDHSLAETLSFMKYVVGRHS